MSVAGLHPNAAHAAGIAGIGHVRRRGIAFARAPAAERSAAAGTTYSGTLTDGGIDAVVTRRQCLAIAGILCFASGSIFTAGIALLGIDACRARANALAGPANIGSPFSGGVTPASTDDGPIFVTAITHLKSPAARAANARREWAFLGEK
jgi:hypothetical protein